MFSKMSRFSADSDMQLPRRRSSARSSQRATGGSGGISNVASERLLSPDVPLDDRDKKRKSADSQVCRRLGVGRSRCACGGTYAF